MLYLYNLETDPGETKDLSSDKLKTVLDLFSELVNWHRDRGFHYPRKSNPAFSGSVLPHPVAYPDVLVLTSRERSATLNILANDIPRRGDTAPLTSIPVQGDGIVWPSSLSLSANGDLVWTPPQSGQSIGEFSALYEVKDATGSSHVSIIVCRLSAHLRLQREVSPSSSTSVSAPTAPAPTAPDSIAAVPVAPVTSTRPMGQNATFSVAGDDTLTRGINEDGHEAPWGAPDTPDGSGSSNLPVALASSALLVCALAWFAFRGVRMNQQPHGRSGWEVMGAGLIVLLLLTVIPSLLLTTSSEQQATRRSVAGKLQATGGSAPSDQLPATDQTIIVTTERLSPTPPAPPATEASAVVSPSETKSLAVASNLINKGTTTNGQLQPAACLGVEVEHPGRSVCKETNCYVFIKTHKTGSSTLTNLLHRRNLRLGLLTGLPSDLVWLGWPGSLKYSNLLGYHKRWTHANALVNHVRLDEGERCVLCSSRGDPLARLCCCFEPLTGSLSQHRSR